MKITYWIAKYIDDVFRDEPKNIGVFVEIQSKFYSKFLGEVGGEGIIDGRKVKNLYPEVYKQWIEFWRRKLNENDFKAIVEHKGANFNVVRGGEISDTEQDNPEDILNYVYSILVSEGGFKEAIGVSEETSTSFVQDLINIFSEKNLLANEDQSLIKHPIKKDISIEIEIKNRDKIKFNPQFVQENGKRYVIDIADFTTLRKRGTRDHAGYLAYIYNYLLLNQQFAFEPITLLKATESDKESEDVMDGISLLRNEGAVVDWLNHKEREKFLMEREEIANS